jgi:hypothetical protein
MNNEEIKTFLSELKLEKNILLEEIPNLDLYMDQVIQLFENKYIGTLRSENDKVITKTMINNYSKDKVFMQAKNKRYSKEHLILLSLIYQLKGSFSITDIKNALKPIVKQVEEEKDYPLENFYSTYLKQYEQNVNFFKKDIAERLNVQNELPSTDYESNLLLLISHVTMSNMYRKFAEKILDDLLSV